MPYEKTANSAECKMLTDLVSQLKDGKNTVHIAEFDDPFQNDDPTDSEFIYETYLLKIDK